MDKKTRDVIRLLCNMPVKPVNPFRGDGGFRSPSDATPLGSKSPAERAKETADRISDATEAAKLAVQIFREGNLSDALRTGQSLVAILAVQGGNTIHLDLNALEGALSGPLQDMGWYFLSGVIKAVATYLLKNALATDEERRKYGPSLQEWGIPTLKVKWFTAKTEEEA